MEQIMNKEIEAIANAEVEYVEDVEEISNKRIMRLAIPIAFQSLIQSSLSLIDQIMVAGLGATAMAAAGLALRPLTIVFFMFLGISGALNVFVAQYWGDGKAEKIVPSLRIAIKYALAILLPIGLLTLLIPREFMSLFSRDVAVIEEGISYLRIISGTFIPLMIIMLLSGIMKSCGSVIFPMVAGIISVLLNTILNFWFIYGGGLLPPLGLKGAALATLIARIVEMLIIIIGLMKIKILDVKSEELTMEERQQFSRVTWPLLISELIFICSITFYAILYGRMGTKQMAAMTILFPIQNIAFGLFAGISTASAALIGQALGKGAFDIAKNGAKKIIKLTFLLGTLLSMSFIAFLPFYLRLFSLEKDVYRQAQVLIIVAMFILPFQILNMVIYEGVLRTGGETGYLMKIQVLTLWGIGIPAGILTGFMFKFPLQYVFLAVSLEEIIRFLMNYNMMRKEAWIAKLTTHEVLPL